MRHFSILFLVFSVFPSLATAGGIQLNLQGSRQLGMAHTGVGVALDGSSLFFNPGATALVSGRRIHLGGTLVMPSTAYLVPNPGIDVTQTQAQVFTPFYLYASWRARPQSRITFGLAVNNPFGAVVRWPDVWPGMYISQEVSVSSLFIQPTVSVKLTNRLGIGAGLVYGNTNMLLRKAMKVSTIASEVPSSVTLSGRGDGFGFNLGLYFQPSDVFSMGINYRSRLRTGKSTGEVVFDVPPSLEPNYPNSTFSTDVTLPGSLNLGLGYRPEESILLTFDLNYTAWSVYDSLILDLEPGTLPDVRSERNYQNVLAFRLGGEGKVSPRLSLRGGVYYDQSPIQDGYVSPEYPDADRVGFTTGAGINLQERLSLDMSFAYETTGERTTAFTEQGFGGTYQSHTFMVGLGLNYSY